MTDGSLTCVDLLGKGQTLTDWSRRLRLRQEQEEEEQRRGIKRQKNNREMRRRRRRKM